MTGRESIPAEALAAAQRAVAMLEAVGIQQGPAHVRGDRLEIVRLAQPLSVSAKIAAD
jgi:hypothetical protein